MGIGATGTNVGDIVESLRFVAGEANPVVVGTTIRGATVSRAGLGIYDVTLAVGSQVDPTMRTVKVTVGGAATASLAQEDLGAATDLVIRVRTFDVAGNAADTGANVTVEVTRTSNG